MGWPTMGWNDAVAVAKDVVISLGVMVFHNGTQTVVLEAQTSG